MFNFGLAEAVAAPTPAPTRVEAGRGRDALTRELLTPRPQSPDAGRGADAGRKGIQDVRMSEGENVVLRLEA